MGESILTVKNNQQIRDEVINISKNGVEFSSCVVCAEGYDAIESLESIGIVCNHTGELLTTALKDDKSWAMLTL